MGTAPQPPGPPPALAIPGLSFGASVGLPPSLPAVSLCGFSFPPKLLFKFGFTLPVTLSFPPPLPIPHLSLSLNCNLSNPIGVTAGLKWGAGRTSNALPDPDVLEQAG